MLAKPAVRKALNAQSVGVGRLYACLKQNARRVGPSNRNALQQTLKSFPEWKIWFYSTSLTGETGGSRGVGTHVTGSQLHRFVVGALEDDELTLSARHVADCQSCHKALVEELRRRVGGGPFTFNPEHEFVFRDDHLEFEDLVSIADEMVDQELKEIWDIHLKTCEGCREDLTSFLAFRRLENESAR